jgi:hypothetical protein
MHHASPWRSSDRATGGMLWISAGSWWSRLRLFDLAVPGFGLARPGLEEVIGAAQVAGDTSRDAAIAFLRAHHPVQVWERGDKGGASTRAERAQSERLASIAAWLRAASSVCAATATVAEIAEADLGVVWTKELVTDAAEHLAPSSVAVIEAPGIGDLCVSILPLTGYEPGSAGAGRDSESRNLDCRRWLLLEQCCGQLVSPSSA